MVKTRLCSIPGRSSSDFGKIKILSEHLLPQGEGVLARASLIAVKVQCRPDFPLENLSMDVSPAHQPHSPLAFPSGGWATFPMLGTVPHTTDWNTGSPISGFSWSVSDEWVNEFITRWFWMCLYGVVLPEKRSRCEDKWGNRWLKTSKARKLLVN